MEKEWMTIVNADGTEEKVIVLLAFGDNWINRHFVAYVKSDFAADRNALHSVYVSEVIDSDDGTKKLVGIANEEEWEYVREYLNDIAPDCSRRLKSRGS